MKQLGLPQRLHDMMAQAYDIILELTDTFEAIQSLTVACKEARKFRKNPYLANGFPEPISLEKI